MNFMHAFGLKLYNAEDCAKAQSIAQSIERAMIEDDDQTDEIGFDWIAGFKRACVLE